MKHQGDVLLIVNIVLSSTTHGVRFLNIERVKKELNFYR